MIDLDTLVLARGGHRSPEDGLCVMEAAVRLRPARPDDHPRPVLTVGSLFSGTP